MTSNQIAYWNLQEQKRTNLANEAIKGDTLVETKRSNKVQEQLKTKDINSQIGRRDVQNEVDWVNARSNRMKSLFGPLSLLLK